MGKVKNKRKNKTAEKPFERETGILLYFDAEKTARKAFLAELHRRCVNSLDQ